MGNITIHHADEIKFAYGSGDQVPYVISKSAVSWDRQERVDPFPCYAHDEKLVREMADRCAESFYPYTDVAINIMHYEGLDRYNGCCDTDWKYVNDNERVMGIRICLSGKRICLHPAMTRYLVPHEYGHGVEKWLYCQMGMKDTDEFREFYKNEVRKSDAYTEGYTARKWHSNIGELIANDFRIILVDAERDFWPHEGFCYPKNDLTVFKFWLDVRDKYGKPKSNTAVPDNNPV